MALQVRRAANKLINPALNLVRHRSRSSSVPSLFWDDPFKRHRSLLSDFWNTPDPFDWALSTRFAPYRVPYWEGEKYFNSPEDGFQVSLNVKQFKPEEVSVKVADNNIIIEAKHEERNEDDSYVSRHFSRRYAIPDNCDMKDVVSTLSTDGILSVRVPPKEIDHKNARKIPIQQTGSAHIEPDTTNKVEEQKPSEEEKKQ